MRQLSISLRLTLWFSAVFLCGFVVFGVVMWADLSYSLASGRDRTLSRRATRALDAVNAPGNDTDKARAARFAQFADALPEGGLVHIIDLRGTWLFPQVAAPGRFPWPRPQFLAGDRWSKVMVRGGEYRVLERPATVGSRPVLVVVAGQLSDNRQMLARFQTGLFAATPALLALSALAGYFMSRRVFRPVGQMTGAMRSISIGNLAERLPIHHTGDEFERLAETCNDMLARLEGAVARINRFTADASHELRSPISFMRTVSEYSLRNAKLDDESRQGFEEILTESLEAGRLLEDMLILARADAGHLDLILEPVDLADLVRDVCDKVRPLAENKRQILAVHVPDDGISVRGDRSRLRRLIWTLLDNAVKYTPEHGRIAAALEWNGDAARFSVADSGIGIAPELLPRVFERFFRADPARSEVDGTGLGLAIAKWIADVHHATLSVSSVEGKGSAFSVTFAPDGECTSRSNRLSKSPATRAFL